MVLPMHSDQQVKLGSAGCLLLASQAQAPVNTKLFEFFVNSAMSTAKTFSSNFVMRKTSSIALPALAEELVSHKVDVLITPGTPSALALRNATKTIPIVFVDVTDPVGAGLVKSLARPGSNLTGFSSIESVLVGKRLELLKETVGDLSRVAVLWDPQNFGARHEWEESQTAARDLGLRLHSMEVSSADQYERVFDQTCKTRGTGLAVLSNALAASSQQIIVDLAAKHRLAAIYFRREFVALGGLISYGPDQTERLQARSRTDRQNPQGREARRSSNRAADQI